MWLSVAYKVELVDHSDVVSQRTSIYGIPVEAIQSIPFGSKCGKKNKNKETVKFLDFLQQIHDKTYKPDKKMLCSYFCKYLIYDWTKLKGYREREKPQSQVSIESHNTLW